MEIALFGVLAFVAYLYFSAEKERSALHKAFSLLLVVMLVHLQRYTAPDHQPPPAL